MKVFLLSAHGDRLVPVDVHSGHRQKLVMLRFRGWARPFTYVRGNLAHYRD